MNKIKTIDDALAVLNEARAKYGNLSINILIDDGINVTADDCLSILYDEDGVTFYNY